MNAQPVVIVDYDPQWPVEFEQIRRIIALHVGTLAVVIEHVGSTAVPGLSAKPILDIVVVIPSRDLLPALIEKLAPLGYVHEGDRGITGREAFDRLGPEAPRDGSGRLWSEQHLYVCARDNRELARQLHFRNALRQHPELALEYAMLKRDLARQYTYDRVAYTDGKASFIERVLKEVELA